LLTQTCPYVEIHTAFLTPAGEADSGPISLPGTDSSPRCSTSPDDAPPDPRRARTQRGDSGYAGKRSSASTQRLSRGLGMRGTVEQSAASAPNRGRGPGRFGLAAVDSAGQSRYLAEQEVAVAVDLQRANLRFPGAAGAPSRPTATDRPEAVLVPNFFVDWQLPDEAALND